jgi:hypothetical protein
MLVEIVTSTNDLQPNTYGTPVKHSFVKTFLKGDAGSSIVRGCRKGRERERGPMVEWLMQEVEYILASS